MDMKKMFVLLGVCIALLSVVQETEACEHSQHCHFIQIIFVFFRVCTIRTVCYKRGIGMEVAMDASKTEVVMEPLPNAFASYDKNNDKKISEAEFEATIKDVARNETKKLFGEIDANKDGSITCGEFLKAKISFGKNKPKC